MNDCPNKVSFGQGPRAPYGTPSKDAGAPRTVSQMANNVDVAASSNNGGVAEVPFSATAHKSTTQIDDPPLVEVVTKRRTKKISKRVTKKAALGSVLIESKPSFADNYKELCNNDLVQDNSGEPSDALKGRILKRVLKLCDTIITLTAVVDKHGRRDPELELLRAAIARFTTVKRALHAPTLLGEFLSGEDTDLTKTWTPSKLARLFEAHGGQPFHSPEDLKTFSKRTNRLLELWNLDIRSPIVPWSGRFVTSGSNQTMSLHLRKYVDKPAQPGEPRKNKQNSVSATLKAGARHIPTDLRLVPQVPYSESIRQP